ncbi:MAG: hypothetical protein LC799_23385 [Actinobacteria bacterium]|nr:hypothetical protein [Actinomycetota bacterium]
MGIRMRFLAVTAVASLGLAACAGQENEGVGQPPSRAPSSVSAEPGAADRPGASSVSERGSLGSTSPQTPRPAAGGRSLSPNAGAGPKTSSLHQGFPVLVGVRTGSHPGYTRYVFDFTNADPDGHSPLGSARPGWDVRYVAQAEAVQDGSGDPPPVGGAVYLRIRFDGAAAHYDDGTPSIRYGLDAHSALGFGGDFEGHVTWFLGMERQQPFKLSFVETNKVVVDVVNAQ